MLRDFENQIIAECQGGRADTYKTRMLVSQCPRAANNCMLYACKIGDFNVAESLVKLGANNYYGGLMSACEGGDTENHSRLVQVMLDRNVSACDALQYACEYGRIGIASMIIEYMSTRVNRESLTYSVNKGFVCACANGHVEAVSVLISFGADDFDEALRVACKNNQADVVYMLLDRGAKNIKQGFDETCRGGHVDVARTLLKTGTMDLTDALIVAARYGRVEIIRVVINEAEKHGVYLHYNCALTAACETPCCVTPELLHVLLNGNTSYTDTPTRALAVLVKANYKPVHIDLIQTLIRHGAELPHFTSLAIATRLFEHGVPREKLSHIDCIDALYKRIENERDPDRPAICNSQPKVWKVQSQLTRNS